MNIKLPDPCDYTKETWLDILQHRVGSRYVVSPVDSQKAYEEVDYGGKLMKVVHNTFIYRIPEASVTNVAMAVELIWAEICDTFKAGTFVVWRIRPTIRESESTCPCCKITTKHLEVRLRIGALETTKDVNSSHFEQAPIKQIPQ